MQLWTRSHDPYVCNAFCITDLNAEYWLTFVPAGKAPVFTLIFPSWSRYRLVVVFGAGLPHTLCVCYCVCLPFVVMVVVVLLVLRLLPQRTPYPYIHLGFYPDDLFQPPVCRAAL